MKKSRSLQFKLYLSMFSIFVLIAISMFVFVMIITNGPIINTLNGYLSSKMNGKIKFSSQIIEQNIKASLYLRDLQPLRKWLNNSETSDTQEMLTCLNAIRKITGEDTTVFIGRASDGSFYYNNEFSEILDKNDQDDSWFYDTLNSDRDYLLNLDYNESLNTTKVWMNIPVRNNKGEAVGVVGTGIDLTSFINTLLSSEDERELFLLINENGDVVASPEPYFENKNIIAILPDNIGKTVRNSIRSAKSSDQNHEMIMISSDELDYGAKIHYIEEFDWYFVTAIDVKTINNVIIRSFFITLLVAFSLLMLAAAFIGITISRPLVKQTKKLNQSLVSFRSESSEISKNSYELSQDSGNLASTIEEITSSIEELQAVIENNAGHMNEAVKMMEQSNGKTQNVNTVFEKMNAAMLEINENSRKIYKIISVIDDIAFQTNILALNASVEAARAGEVGKGFAVVADQVKSLAGKSAEAAKETSVLIEKAVNSTENGQKLGDELNSIQKDAADDIMKVAELLKNVQQSTSEQKNTFGQMTKAVSQVNGVVQTTAQSSSNNYSMAKDIEDNAEQVTGIVNQLSLLVYGSKKHQNAEDKKLSLQKQNGQDHFSRRQIKR